MEFTGVDILVGGRIAWNRIRDAVSVALSVPPGRVRVIGDVADYPETDGAEVVCVVSEVSGDFSQLVSIDCRIEVQLESALQVASRLARVLGVQLLAPHEGLDPFVMWLVESSGARKLVGMDTVAFGEEKYVVKEDWAG